MAPRDHNWAWLYQSIPSLLILTLVSSHLLTCVRAQYFVITRPEASSSWANGSPYPLSWSIGLDDPLSTFDIEITRLNEDGLIYVARNVPTSYGTLNVFLQDVPPGDDYFVIGLNSTITAIYTVSSRFTITNSSSAQSNPSPDASAPTVTISGAPNPLKQFAVDLGSAANGGSSLTLGASPNTRALGFGGILVLCAAFLGGVMTFC